MKNLSQALLLTICATQIFRGLAPPLPLLQCIHGTFENGGGPASNVQSGCQCVEGWTGDTCNTTTTGGYCAIANADCVGNDFDSISGSVIDCVIGCDSHPNCLAFNRQSNGLCHLKDECTSLSSSWIDYVYINKTRASGQLCPGIYIDSCASSPCVNGNCTDSEIGFQCECEEGWSGVMCENDIDECASSPCVHGNCTDLENAFQCECEEGLTGEMCETNFDECVSSPCVHGNCTDLDNGFQCECEDGWSGEMCENDYPGTIPEGCSTPDAITGLCPPFLQTRSDTMTKMRFLPQTGKRAMTELLNLIDASFWNECGGYCVIEPGCIAFNFNLQQQKCELIGRNAIRASAETEWAYYTKFCCE